MTFTSGINKDKPPVPGGAVVSAVAGSFSYFARALSLELAPTRVNIVSPGWVDTPMFDELVGEAKAGYFEAMAAPRRGAVEVVLGDAPQGHGRREGLFPRSQGCWL